MQDEMDILKEVGNIASAHGSIALSEILGSKIELSVPKTDIIALPCVRDRINTDKIGIAISSKIITRLKGKIIFLLDEKNAFKLNDIAYKIKGEDKNAGVLTELGMSLIKEIGSIVNGAYVSALGMLFKELILLAPPSLISGTIEEILNMILSMPDDSSGEELILIEVMFDEFERRVSGSFFLVLASYTVIEIQNKCKKILESLQA